MYLRYLITGAMALGFAFATTAGAAAADSRMIDQRTLSAAAQEGGWPSGLVPCANPEEIAVGPANIQKTIDARKSQCTRLLLSPGTYERLRLYDVNGMTIRCRTSKACEVDTIVLAHVQYAEITGMHFTGKAKRFNGSTDYGVQIHHVNSILVSDNLFEGRYNHDISTKTHVGYAEVTNNTFIKCNSHCIEIGQNGNVESNSSQSGIIYVAHNTFDHAAINALTQRNNNLLVVYDNTFIQSGQFAIHNWPMWKPFDYGQKGGPEINQMMDGSLRTEIVGNEFSGRNILLFQGRGKSDDTILLKDNRGDFECRLREMPDRARRAHAGVETTAAPRLDPASDKAC